MTDDGNTYEEEKDTIMVQDSGQRVVWIARPVQSIQHRCDQDNDLE